jgi:hypothetical protein
MPSLLARTYGQCHSGRPLCNAGPNSARGARSVKRAHGGATSLSSFPCASRSGRTGLQLKAGVAYQGKWKRAPRPMSTVLLAGIKPMGRIHQGASSQHVGSMRHPLRNTARCASVAKRKFGMVARGANAAVSAKRRRIAYNSSATGACAKRRWQMAASGATGVKVKRLETSHCAERVGDSEHMVGPAQETDAAHAQMHHLAKLDEWAKVCARCFFTKWKRTHNTSLNLKAPPWLMPKPKFMRGAWGLGCIWCAASKDSSTVQSRRREHMRQNKFAGRCQQSISRASKWGDYSHRNLGSGHSLARAVSQHQATDLHRLSGACFRSAACHLDAIKDPRGHSTQRTAHSREVLPTRAEDPPSSQPQRPNEEGFAAMSVTEHCRQMQPAARQPGEECGQRREPTCSSSASTHKAAAVSIGSRTLGSTTDPFRGRVPQVQNWIDVWAETTASVSIYGLFEHVNFVN